MPEYGKLVGVKGRKLNNGFSCESRVWNEDNSVKSWTFRVDGVRCTKALRAATAVASVKSGDWNAVSMIFFSCYLFYSAIPTAFRLSSASFLQKYRPYGSNSAILALDSHVSECSIGGLLAIGEWPDNHAIKLRYFLPRSDIYTRSKVRKIRNWRAVTIDVNPP